MEDIDYLMIALGNGNFISYIFQNNELIEKKKMKLGTCPTKLVQAGSEHPIVFATSDRPCVIHSKSSKLMYSKLNLSKVESITPLSTLDLDGYCFVQSSKMIFSAIELVQKLHVKTYKLGETCRRITYHEASGKFAILSSVPRKLPGDYIDDGYLRIIDSFEFKVVETYEFSHYELATSILSATLDGIEYIIVGTGYALPEDDEPSSGRILVFTLTKTLDFVCELSVNGCVYSLATLGQKVVAAVNSKVMLLTWNPLDKKLSTECIHHGNVLALSLATYSDYIIVGDLMKSITCLFYDAIQQILIVRGRDFETNWMTAVECIDDRTFIGGDNQYNIIMLKRVGPYMRLKSLGGFHLGEIINRFKKGIIQLIKDL
jgi:DNA damage-binding protein 1